MVLLGRDERYGCFFAFLGCGSQGPRFWLCLDFLEIPAFFRAGASNRPFGEGRVAQQAAITGYSKELLFCQPLIGGERKRAVSEVSDTFVCTFVVAFAQHSTGYTGDSLGFLGI